VLEVLLDGRPLGAPFDAWAPAVIASGAIPLGAHKLAAGAHELTLRTRDKNPAATAFHLGVDALELVREGGGTRLARAPRPQLTKPVGSPSAGSSILPKRSS
jgi:hypothetical protein